MQTKTYTVMVGAVIAGLFAVSLAVVSARQALAIDPDDIGGIVSGPKGPEAGVWVIAETRDLPTKFVKTVVTDDAGRYVVPDLPKAQYDIWVRGYGLVDSPKVRAMPGKTLNLTAIAAPNPRAAAEYYPANYWYSLLQIPAESEFPGTGSKGNGIAETLKSQAEWVANASATTCVTCHQMGNKATREFPAGLGTFPTSVAAWERRLQSGQAGGQMIANLNRFGRQRALNMFADWSDRIAAGELPPVPPRPQGVERNLVITAWDYSDPKKYVHDGMATYKSNPTVNAYGPFISAPEASSDDLWVLDPKTHTPSAVNVPIRGAKRSGPTMKNLAPSPYWGDELIWDAESASHSVMWDSRGRLWATTTTHTGGNPAWCREGSSHPSAKVFPLDSGRGASVYDPKTKQVALVDTCFGSHHLIFGDAKFANGKYADWLFINSVMQPVIGWIDVKMWDQTKDAQKSQGWTPLILDTNGNGKRDAWVEPELSRGRGGRAIEGEPTGVGDAAPNQSLVGTVDPAKDTRLHVGFYTMAQSPLDGSVWAPAWSFPGSLTPFPGAIVRIALGDNPPETSLAEVYQAPWGYPGLSGQGHVPRGLDVDRNGVVWTNLSGSSDLASFDRRKCKAPLNGPKATGKHCPEGWTVYPVPGPQFKGVKAAGRSDALYLAFVDQFNTSGLGENVPFVTGSNSDSLLGLVNGKWVVLRVPYPLGFYSKGMDGRIDDPKAGWKGRGLWSTLGNRTPWHLEGGKGTKPQVLQFQLRPNPLAK